MSSVFVCHATGDQVFVERVLLGLLKSLGLDIWYAPESIRASEAWKDSIAAGLQDADWFVVVVSKQAAASEWVGKEVSDALERLPNKIIPIVIDGSSLRDVHESLPDIHCINYHADSDRATHSLVGLLVDAEYRGLQRQLAGKWISAVQAVYYAAGNAWHVQDVEIAPTPRGYSVATIPAPGKLQWRFEAKLVANAFFVGRWFSKRAGSESKGYMSLQISRNGTYMFGHDYGVVFDEGKAHFGVMLLAKTEEKLEIARTAMKRARRKMSSLDKRIDFPGD